MNKSIKAMEAKGWEYVEDLKVTFGNHAIVLNQAWVKDGKFRTFKNGKFGKAQTL